MRLRIQQLSAGRVLTVMFGPEDSTFTMSSKEWSLRSGATLVAFPKAPESEDGPKTEPGDQGTQGRLVVGN